MHRLTLSLFLVALLATAGCNGNYKEESEQWGPSQWKDALREDQERLKSEDQRAGPVFGPFSKAMRTLGDELVRVYDWLTGNTPFDAAKGLIAPYNPDRRRESIMWLANRSYGRQDPYVKYYSQMASNDNDYTVRAMAVRALNRARAKQHMALYIKGLDDPSELVRLESAKAIGNMPDNSAVKPLLRRLNSPDENVEVRVACADALRSYRTAEVAQALVQVLRDREFSICWQARKSLKLITGRDYRYDPAAWLTYLSGGGKPLG